jgi:SAM-dependent methyltransferase
MGRYGQLYGAAVLRPLAEQLAAALDVQPGQTVCDLLCDEGELTRALEARVAPDGTVFATDIDTVIRLGAVPLADGVCDAAGVLFTAGFAANVPSEARRVCGPRGRVLAAVWDRENPPAHERVLEAALQTAARHSSAYLRAVLAVPVTSAGVSLTVHDVVRFDSVAHYWAAMVSQRLPLMAELRAIP